MGLDVVVVVEVVRAELLGPHQQLLQSGASQVEVRDVRVVQLVGRYVQRLEQPELSADQLAPVWCAVLLGVHRGGRQKLKAVRELADAIAREPEQAAGLLPVLAVAVLPMLVFGGESLFAFTLAIVFGVIVGTYSAIYVSSSLMIYMPTIRKWRDEKEVKSTPAKAGA